MYYSNFLCQTDWLTDWLAGWLAGWLTYLFTYLIIRISRFEISRYFVKCVFLTMGSSDGGGLSQLYLELADAFKKRFMLQNGQVAVLKCCPIW